MQDNSAAPRWVILVYIAGMASGFLYEPLSLLTIGWVFWHQRQKLRQNIYALEARVLSWQPTNHPLWAWMPLLGLIAMMLWKGGFTPLDDLPRHIGSYQHGFDYRHFYMYSEVVNSVKMSPWFGYEWVVGHLHRIIWGELGYWHSAWNDLDRNIWALSLTQHIMQILSFACFGMIFVPVFRQIFRHHPMSHAMTGLALTLMLGIGLGVRLQLARPEVFLMLGMFSAWRLPPRVWVVLMMLLQPLYWLGWMYSIGVLFITRWRWTQKAIAMVLILGAYALFWHKYCGLDQVVHFFKLTQKALETRLIHASENQPLLDYMFTPWGVMWGVLLIMAFYQWEQEKLSATERRSILGLVVVWILMNQIRYAAYCIPCLAYLWAKYSAANPALSQRYSNEELKKLLLAILSISMVICWKALPIDGFSGNLPKFRALNSQARVLTFFNASTFLLPTLYPGMKVAPPMEVGFADRPLQQFLKLRWDQKGSDQPLDCQIFKKTLNQFTHVVEADGSGLLSRRPSECLKLEEEYGGWRLWRIVSVGK